MPWGTPPPRPGLIRGIDLITRAAEALAKAARSVTAFVSTRLDLIVEIVGLDVDGNVFNRQSVE